MAKTHPIPIPATCFRAEIISVICICAFISLLIAVAVDLKISFKAVFLAGFVGAAVIALIPNRRIALVMCWILVHPLSLEKVFQFGEPIYPTFFPPQMVVSASDIILIALVSYLILEGLIKRESPLYFSSSMIPLMILTLWTAFVFLFTGPTTHSAMGIIHNLKMLVFVIAMVSSVRTKDELKYVLITIAIAVGIQALLVDITSITGKGFSFSSKNTGELMAFSGAQGADHIRATGTVGHVNQEASFLCFFGLSIFGLMASGTLLKKAAAWVVFTGTMVAVILTFSRSAWVSLSFAGICLLIIVFKKKKIVFKHWLYGPAIIIMVLAIAIAFGRPVIDRLLHGDEGASSSRMRAIHLSLDLIKEHPFKGVGHWNFAKASLENYPPTRLSAPPEKDGTSHYGRLEITQVQLGNQVFIIPLPVHNKYLLVFTELGAIGIMIFLWFQFCIFNHLRKSIRTRDRMLQWTAIGVMTAFWATQTYMNLDLFSDDKTMQILLIVPILGMIVHRIICQQDMGGVS